MKSLFCLILLAFVLGCARQPDSTENPFFAGLNIPVNYAEVSANDIEDYVNITKENVAREVDKIKQNKVTSFKNVFAAMDDIYNKMAIASNNCNMLYHVSPDSLLRVKGNAGQQLLDSLSENIYSDKALYDKMLSFKSSPTYNQLKGAKKILVDDMIEEFERSGVNLNDKKLSKFKKLTKEIKQLSSEYSNKKYVLNEVLILDKHGVEGLSENFKSNCKIGENEYEIPVNNIFNGAVMLNARNEETRKAFYIKFYDRTSDKKLNILDSLVRKRYELANILGYKSYATYNLQTKMAKNPETVWAFINDLADRNKEKANSYIEVLNNIKRKESGSNGKSDLQAWDIAYYENQLLKTKYRIDKRQIREYLPLDRCLKGMFDIYQELLGLEFRKVINPSVWHKEVEMYEVYEGNNLKGRFYLDLFSRPNKESWVYCIPLSSGKDTKYGYEVPVSMLLGNFHRTTGTLPSLIYHGELKTLFHEFGHIIEMMSYHGEFALQADSKADFCESISQIFENWIWDYEMLSRFAKHYKTGEVLPKETFDNMLRFKNVSSAFDEMYMLRDCMYDMNLYDKYCPENGFNNDELWRKIADELDIIQMYVKGTHPEDDWMHVISLPVYYYGYLWSKEYTEDIFTEFEKHGLLDKETGIRYRELILANGKQRDINEAVEEFLGRPFCNPRLHRGLSSTEFATQFKSN